MPLRENPEDADGRTSFRVLPHLFETIEKSDHALGDFAGAGLQSEVSGLDESDLRIGKIALERLCSRRQEEWVVASPHDQRRRPLFTEIALPCRVGGDVGSVVVDEVELYLVLSGPAQIGNVQLG